MPASALVAVISLLSLVLIWAGLGAVALLRGTVGLLPVALTLGLAALILAGLIARNRLAWQWGRILLPLRILLSVMGFVALVLGKGSGEQPQWLAALCSAEIALLVVVFVALQLNSAKEYYGLRCPHCGRLSTKGADFLFTKVKCRSCGNIWKDVSQGPAEPAS